MEAMRFEQLAAHLTNQRGAIMERWRELVRGDVSQPEAHSHLSDVELDDHLPSLIDKLADALRAQATPDVEPEGRAHGHNRRTLQYTISQIVTEFTLFRRVLMDLVQTFYADDGS